MLDAMRERPAITTLAGVVIDSAPGFPEQIPFWVTAKYATLAMMPGLLTSLRRKPRSFHPVLSPPIAVFFGLWHLVARKQVAFMQSGQARVASALAGLPILAIWSDADQLVPAEHVVAFLDRAEREGARVDRLHFERSAHVRHFVEHRATYLARVEAFLATLGS